MIRIDKKKIFVDMFVIISTIILLIINTSHSSAIVVACFVLLWNILALIRGRKSWYTLIISGFILWSNYSICSSNLLFPINDFFTGWKNDPVIILCMSILLVFSSVLAIGMPKYEIKINFYENVTSGNPIIILVAVLALIAVAIYGFFRPDLAGVRGTSSTFYEYSIIIFILAFSYANKRIERIFLTILLFVFVIQDLVYGGRITALQLLLCWFFIFYAHKAKMKYIIPIAIVVILAFTAIGGLRRNFNIGMNVFANAFNALVRSRVALDTAYSAFYTSGTFIISETTLSIGARLEMFGKFLLSMLIGGNAVDGSNLAEYTRQFYTHYYGGVLPYYIHFYLGYFGVIISGVYVSFLQRKLFSQLKNTKHLNYIRCLGVYLACSVPRWYLYSPSPLLRGIILFSVLYIVCYGFNRFTNKLVDRKSFNRGF